VYVAELRSIWPSPQSDRALTVTVVLSQPPAFPSQPSSLPHSEYSGVMRDETLTSSPIKPLPGVSCLEGRSNQLRPSRRQRPFPRICSPMIGQIRPSQVTIRCPKSFSCPLSTSQNPAVPLSGSVPRHTLSNQMLSDGL